ncbi:MAG: cation:proton antiporter [Hyphomonadaceae bacterium]|nr:cation:proton antiporter [Hyphomonadaceae bacterium]
MIAISAAGVIAAAMALALVRLFLGPTLHDRLLAAYAFALFACALVAAIAAAARRPDFVDVAIAMALGVFVLLTAAAKFLRYRSFQTALAPRQGEEGARA